MTEQVTCPQCDEPCTPEELAQWEMCHDCENAMCEVCSLFEGHENWCAIGIHEYLNNPE